MVIAYRQEQLKSAKTTTRKIKLDWGDNYTTPVYVEEIRILYKNSIPDHLYKFVQENSNKYAGLIKYVVLSKSGKTKNVNFFTLTDKGYVQRQDPYDDVETKDILIELNVQINWICDLVDHWAFPRNILKEEHIK